MDTFHAADLLVFLVLTKIVLPKAQTTAICVLYKLLYSTGNEALYHVPAVSIATASVLPTR